MSKCDLRVELDKREYRPGETIRGTVQVATDAAVKCKALTVTLQWRTHGRGNRAQGVTAFKQVFEGEWTEGQQSYPFTFTAPPGPGTYHGHILNIDHYVTATADIPWSLDPKDEVEILLPAVDSAHYPYGPEYKPPTELLQASHSGSNIGSLLLGGCFGVPGCAISIGGLGFALSVLRGNMENVFPAIFMTLFGIPFMAVGFGVAFMLQKRRMAQAKIGQPMVKVSPNPARPGERVTVQAILEPRGAITLADGKVSFKGLEQVVSGSGTDRTTHSHEVHNEERPLSTGGRNVQPGETVSLQESFTVPETAAPTFMADDNHLKWTVSLAIGIDGWPDWEQDYPLTIRPK
jgi:hypothetical protein